MAKFDHAALLMGYALMLASGAIAAIAVLIAAYYLLGGTGMLVWQRLRRVYHLSVIWYWLPRLEREGKRVFQKAWEGDQDA